MRKTFILHLLLVITLFGQSQEISVKTQVSEATVYKQGAEITRTASVQLAENEVELIFDKLDPMIDASSLRFTAKADITIIHQHNVLYNDTIEKPSDPINVLLNQKRQKQIVIEKERLNKSLLVYSKEEAFLQDNLKPGTKETTMALAEVIKATEFVRSRYLNIRAMQAQIEDQIMALDAEYSELNEKLQVKGKFVIKQFLRLSVKLKSNTSQNAKIELHYYMPAAGWISTYEAKVKDEDQKFELITFAKVFQQSNEDWNNIKISITNSNPTQEQSLPNLGVETLRKIAPIQNQYRETKLHNQNYLNAPWNRQIKNVSGKLRDENGEPLPFVNVVLPATNTGTTTDFDGNFSIDIPHNNSSIKFDYIGYSSLLFNISSSYMDVIMTENTQVLCEVAIMGIKGSRSDKNKEDMRDYDEEYSPVVISYTPTQVRFEPQGKYSIPSNGEYYAIALENREIPVEYHRECVPSLNPAVFLTAKIPNWQSYNLLAGPMNIYLGNMYVGASRIDPSVAGDTLSLSLGVDQDIMVKEQNLIQRNEKKLLGSKIERERSFEISLRNNKRTDVELSIYDRIPVSMDEDIKVSLNESAGAILDEKSGKLTWNIKLGAGEQKQVQFGYTVTHPTGIQLNASL